MADYEAAFAQALAHHRAGELDAAEAAYREILRDHKARPPLLANLAAVLRRRGVFEEPEALLRRAIALAPELRGLRCNLGNLLDDQGRLAEAAGAYRGELALDPTDRESRLGLARAELAQGDFAEGWRMLDARPERDKAVARGLTGPEWRGEPLAGKRLLVWPEQGFGDQIIMMRFIRRLAGEVTLVCMPQLLRLFGQLPATRIPMAERMTAPPYDYWTLPLSLPLALGEAAKDLATAPYLSGIPRSAGGIGVAWRGNARPDPGRSLPPELGAELLAMPGAVSLHPEDSGAQDFQDTADLIAGLDLVVSIDTSVAHLAGAMGKPCLVLHQHRAREWRWRTGADGRSVWYPSATVLHQPTVGDWRSVIDRVKADWPVS
jgi:hypothetical protein